MIASRARRAGAALLILCAATACSGTGASGTGSSPRPTASTDELEELYRARMDSARMRFTEADVRFMHHMIVHHAQAVVMARLAPANGAGPSIRTLAARILNAQRDEIASMRRWLRDRDRTVPDVRLEGTGPAMHGADADMRMPGMLTPEQMRELERAHGAEFDRLFLTYMIEHHRGAVTMVDELFGTDGAAQDDSVFRLASDIQVDQKTEIARMERMLDSLPAGADR